MVPLIMKLVIVITLFLQCYCQDANTSQSSVSIDKRSTASYNSKIKNSNSTPSKSILSQKLYQLSVNQTLINQTLVKPIFIEPKEFTSLVKSLGLGKVTQKQQNISGSIIKCLKTDDILSWYTGGTKPSRGLTEDEFRELCPTLLLQIHTRVCKTMAKETIVVKDKVKIWLYSSGAVLLCSLVGLIVVWLIPILPTAYYNSISQLLIALAVGSLTGDALLHLIPHALVSDDHGHSHGKGNDKSHSDMVWKSLIAFIGIHLFFITERITILCQNWKSKRKLKSKQLSHDNLYREIPSVDAFDDQDKIVKFSDSKSIIKPHWASKSRKYSGSSREMEYAGSHNGLDGDANNIGAHLCNRPKNKPHVNSDCPDSMNIDLCHTTNPYSMVEEATDSQDIETVPENKVSNINGNVISSNSHIATEESANNNNGFENNWINKGSDKHILHCHNDSTGNNIEIKVLVPKQQETPVEIGAGGATVRSSLAHPFQNKPHGHHHGHSHDLSSVKAIAYTVIVGDGLHNFCDGIAIGAAFANDLRGGLSTAIAVLCHELPHELGDFVVLLHAGMSFRTAIFYNLLSSIFCAAGMVIGVLLGSVPSVSSWIFMITAGMFLYIALVDMMPELSTRRLSGNKFVHKPSILFLWQNVGLILGAVIMLLIALYEESMI